MPCFFELSPRANEHKTMPTSSPSPHDTAAQANEPGGDTKSSLLDAAESLIAEKGVARASLRAITQLAKANLAAANYHFGSKEGLVRAVVRRHLRPMNAQRLELLDEVLAEAGDEGPELEPLVRAFIGPVVRYGTELRGRRRHIARLFGRAMTQHDETLRSVILEELQEVIQRFVDAFAEALPHLERRELWWRFHFMVGSMAHLMATGDILAKVTEGLCDLEDHEGIVDRLTIYVCAGLRAPAPFGS